MYTVAVTFLGRRDGTPMPGVNLTTTIGRFNDYAEAREAAMSWEADQVFNFQATCVEVVE